MKNLVSLTAIAVTILTRRSDKKSSLSLSHRKIAA